MASLRQSSQAGTPASASRSMLIVCSSEKRFFMRMSPLLMKVLLTSRCINQREQAITKVQTFPGKAQKYLEWHREIVFKT